MTERLVGTLAAEFEIETALGAVYEFSFDVRFLGIDVASFFADLKAAGGTIGDASIVAVTRTVDSSQSSFYLVDYRWGSMFFSFNLFPDTARDALVDAGLVSMPRPPAADMQLNGGIDCRDPGLAADAPFELFALFASYPDPCILFRRYSSDLCRPGPHIRGFEHRGRGVWFGEAAELSGGGKRPFVSDLGLRLQARLGSDSPVFWTPDFRTDRRFPSDPDLTAPLAESDGLPFERRGTVDPLELFGARGRSDA